MVIIFGASSGGEKILRELIDLQIDFFVDNDSEKMGHYVFWISCVFSRSDR